MIDLELERLRSQCNTSDVDTDLFAVNYLLKCDGNANEVAKKFEEVMISLDLALLRDTTLDAVDWKNVLPKWFVGQCRPERTAEEKRQYLEWWDNLSEKEKLREGQKKQVWSLNNWLHWMYPDEREWYWHSFKVLTKNDLLLTILVYGHPYPDGALKWLASAAGCTEILLS